MKTLYLMRHAKSSWQDPMMDDYDRPLNPRGMRAAPQMGQYMADKGYRPDLILCSSARRTIETLSLIKPFIGLALPTLVEDGLYLAPAETIIDRAQEIEDGHGSALMVGHNPGLEDAIAMLADASKSTVPVPNAVPTAALAVFAFDIASWHDVKDGAGALIDYAVPRGAGEG